MKPYPIQRGKTSLAGPTHRDRSELERGAADGDLHDVIGIIAIYDVGQIQIHVQGRLIFFHLRFGPDRVLGVG